MKNKILILITTLFLIGLVSSIYPGETLTFENTFGTDQLIYTIIDNTSELTILPVITIDPSNITIHIPTETPPQSFKIVFLEETTNTVVETIVVSSGGGGGSSRTKYITKEVIKEVPNYITQYEEKTVEKLAEWVEEEVPAEGKPLWIAILLLVLFLMILGIAIWIIYKAKQRSYSNENIELEGGKEYE